MRVCSGDFFVNLQKYSTGTLPLSTEKSYNRIRLFLCEKRFEGVGLTRTAYGGISANILYRADERKALEELGWITLALY